MKTAAVCFVLCAALRADPLVCKVDMAGASGGMAARVSGDKLAIEWTGERSERLRAEFAIERGTPVVHELAVAGKADKWVTLGRSLVPEFTVTSGVRRAAHGLPNEHRWDVFWDAPLTIPGAGENPGLPRRPEEIRRAESSFESHSCEARGKGARLEISFPGLSLGIFAGRLQFTVYEGSSLLRVEAIASTNEPSVAYIYTAGLRGFSSGEMDRVTWLDPAGYRQEWMLGGGPNGDPVPLIARNRIATATGAGGSIAVFPPPHQFFFARELETNM